MSKQQFAAVLARCFLAGEPELDAMVERCRRMLGREWRWLRPIARRYREVICQATRPRLEALANSIHHDEHFERVWARHHKHLGIHTWITDSPVAQPMEAAKGWEVSRIETARELADWFWLEDGQLEWFADLRGLGNKTQREQLRHYHYRILAKRSGGMRLIEVPKPRLKEMQRQILEYILDAIPAHPAVHGFVKGRSIKSFSAPHVGRAVVLRMDIQNFFPSFSCARIQAFFRTVGYPEMVADLLGGICTAAVPATVWKKLDDPAYSARHLPQGAPTSPALANLCAYRMDCRLNGLANAAGAKYTRYADDLAFSGDGNFERAAERFSVHAAAILMEEGFAVQHRKTRVMRRGVRQELAGLVTNEKLNVSRHHFDELKATLHNCARLGPDSQNRQQHVAFRDHLNGRVGFVESVNPARGAKLRRLFERIEWPLL